MTYSDCLQYRYSCRSLLYSLSYGEVWVMAARICMQLFCMKLCFTSRKQIQIDDFQKGTGQILKFINLALFDRLRVAKSNMSPATSCYDYPIVVMCFIYLQLYMYLHN